MSLQNDYPYTREELEKALEQIVHIADVRGMTGIDLLQSLKVRNTLTVTGDQVAVTLGMGFIVNVDALQPDRAIAALIDFAGKKDEDLYND